MNYKPHYSRFLEGHKGWLHLCAHSHHFWLDLTREAQIQAWDEASQLSDRKWEVIFEKILPQVQNHLVEVLGFRPDTAQRITFAPNTHELYSRLISCFDNSIRLLTTDSEFHSFRRQTQRLNETTKLGDQLVHLNCVAQYPRETFADRFLKEAQKAHQSGKPYDVIFLSHVFFNSGGVVPNCEALLKSLAPLCQMLILDTYHSFFARPFSLEGLENEIYVLGGGYKYLQSGEGTCFLYTPPKAESLRPQNTGWFAHFESLDRPHLSKELVDYSKGAFRFWGSTFDPTGLYRLRSVFDFIHKYSLNVEKIHKHSIDLQNHFLKNIENSKSKCFENLKSVLDKVLNAPERGNFLSFQLSPNKAKQIQNSLLKQNILCDSRESGDSSFLRFGLGLYHDFEDINQYIK